MALEDEVAAATTGELIEMLYARAVRDLKGACELFSLAVDPRAKADATSLIVHAQQVIAELNRSLNTATGGELAANLQQLYEYMQHRLTEAVASADAKTVTEVAGLLEELRQAWETLNKKEKGGMP